MYASEYVAIGFVCFIVGVVVVVVVLPSLIISQIGAALYDVCYPMHVLSSVDLPFHFHKCLALPPFAKERKYNESPTQ